MRKTIVMMNHYAAQPKYSGGRRYHDWAKHLIGLGYDVYIVCSSVLHGSKKDLLGNEEYRIVEDEDVKYVYVKTNGYTGNGLTRVLNMFSYYFAAKRVVKKLPKPEAIIARSPNPLACVAGIQLASRRGSVCISDIVDLWPESIVVYKGLSRKNPLIRLLSYGERWIYRKSNALIFSMAGGYAYLTEKGWERSIPREKVFYVNMGVDVEQFDYNASANVYDEERLTDTTVFKVAYCGSVSLVNDLRLLCDAGRIVADRGYSSIFIMIHGSGDQVEELQRYCIDNKIHNVMLYGYIEKKNIPYVLTNSDLCILCYQNTPLLKYGGSMNKMFEYFASGRPIISNAQMGYSLISQYKCGDELGSNDPTKLADSIIRFAKMSTEERNAYGAGSRQAAEDYNIRNMCLRMEEAVKYALKKKI